MKDERFFSSNNEPTKRAIRRYYEMVRDLLEHQELEKSKHPIAHWVYNHKCDVNVLLVFDFCRIIFPKKNFKIVMSKDHAFVVDEDEIFMYDFIWFLNGIPPEIVSAQKIKKRYNTKQEYIDAELAMCE